MINSVEAVLQARKVYKDLHQAYDADKVATVLKDWLDEKHALAYESNLALEELGYLYGASIMSESLAQVHQVIKQENLGEDIEDIRIKPVPIPSNVTPADFSFLGEENEPEEDLVNHPKHYKLANGIEAIDLMEMTSTPPEFCGHLRNNALKYIIRAGKKDPSKFVEDLDKAIWYLTKLKDYYKKCEEKEY